MPDINVLLHNLSPKNIPSSLQIQAPGKEDIAAYGDRANDQICEILSDAVDMGSSRDREILTDEYVQKHQALIAKGIKFNKARMAENLGQVCAAHLVLAQGLWQTILLT